MKKILFSVFAMAAMLFATSCSQEEDFAPVTDGTEVEVYFSAQLPQEISTRVYSDGTTANKLHYAVYAKESNKTLFTGVVDIQDKKANVPLILANGMTYDLIFWAQSNNATAYSLDWDAQTMTVDYKALKANDENNDAFYKFIEFTVDGTTNKKEVVLTRPFAQINLGTSDFAAAATAGFVPDRSNLVISTTLPNVLNFVDGSVSGKVENATFAVNAFAKGENKEEFPVEPTKYEYLEMSYVLVNAKELIDCTFNVWKEGEENSTITPIVVSNVPVQRNHRTNIFGALLTNPTEFEITIDERFDTPDNNIERFRGVKVNESLYENVEDALAAAVDGDVIYLGTGEYQLPAYIDQNKNYKNIVFEGIDITTVLLGRSTNPWGTTDKPGVYAGRASTLKFKNLTYKTNCVDYTGSIEGGALTINFEECTIIGEYRCMQYVSGSSTTFKNCTFELQDEFICTYGAAKTIFESCTFMSNNGKALQVYDENWGGSVVDIKDCTFTASEPATISSNKWVTWNSEPVAAIEIRSILEKDVTVNITNCSETGYAGGLWAVKYAAAHSEPGNVTVIVDGETKCSGKPNEII